MMHFAMADPEGGVTSAIASPNIIFVLVKCCFSLHSYVFVADETLFIFGN